MKYQLEKKINLSASEVLDLITLNTKVARLRSSKETSVLQISVNLIYTSISLLNR